PVLLACAPHEQHTLPLHALAAGLAEQRVPLRMLGARVPTTAVPGAARRTDAGAIFLWWHCADEYGTPAEVSAQQAAAAESADLAELAELTRSRPARRPGGGGSG